MKKDEILALFEEHPNGTLRFLADKVGLSRERVRQVLAEQGLRTVRARGRGKTRIFKHCVLCNRRKKTTSPYCIHCRKMFFPRKSVIICEECGKRFERGFGEIRSREKRGHKARFCSRSCRSKWMARYQRAGSGRKLG